MPASKRLTVLLGTIYIAEHEVGARDLAEASKIVEEFRDHHGFGASEWTGGLVRDRTGKPVAEVSYNGRVWALPDSPGGRVLLHDSWKHR